MKSYDARDHDEDAFPFSLGFLFGILLMGLLVGWP